MAIAHVATEYVFSDFLLKEPNQARYRSVRTELAVDKMVTWTQISCFAPTNFSWRQAAYVDSYCWAAVHTHTLPLWLHKSDLGFIMEELDRCYNRAVTLAKRMATDSEPAEGCFNYPLVEKFLMTKRCSRAMLFYYLSCRGLTLVTLLCACIYLGYYLRLASVTDEFGCSLRVGLLASDPDIPDKVQCKLIAHGQPGPVHCTDSCGHLCWSPSLLCHGYARFLETYQSLPTVSVLPTPAGQWDDLSLYLLYLEENISELKSYKYMKVLELLRRRGECSGENFDSLGLLQTLCPVKMDTVDGKKLSGAAGKRDQVKTNTADPVSSPSAAENSCNHPKSPAGNDSDDDHQMDMEMTELTHMLVGNGDETDCKNSQERTVKQRAT
ncbi:hypothetical protein INR49_016759 [Caranx melampygus]|nr:hypothetical protein INR49_016759 [Caranx melampygus]